MKALGWVILCCFSLLAFGQNSNSSKSVMIGVGKPVLVKPADLKTRWQAKLVNLEAPSPDGNSYRSWLMRTKQHLPARPGFAKKSPSSVAEVPIITSSFEGNYTDGLPNDNDLAISNGGQLISVINSNIIFFDTQTDSLLFSISLEDFSDTLGLTASMYDPKVMYDPQQDRFIFVCLSGNTDSTSNIVLAFSASNQLMGGWYFYRLPGDALNNNTWTDYPMLALTEDELFLTANSLINDTFPPSVSDSWKYLFQQSFIWQIDKARGYAGDSLITRYHYNILFNNKPIRNLCPVRGGSDLQGPNLFLLSNRNFDLLNDTIFVVQVTGTINQPGLQVLVNFARTDIPYGLPPDADQKGNRLLQTNDARILAAYYENNRIHYVQNCYNPTSDTARSAIYHGIINDPGISNNIEGYIIGDDSLDFGYPNIAYSGRYPGDEEAIITFLHTSEDTSASISAVFYNGNSGYSDRITIKQGETFVTRGGSYVRWGDYTGSQRKYDQPGTVWMSGYWGKVLTGNPLLGTRVNATWIAALSSPDSSLVSQVAEQPEENTVKLFPNPTDDLVNITFSLPNSEMVRIELVDMSGRIVKTFIHDLAQKGQNRFTFSTSPLDAGHYVLIINTGKGVIMSEKISKY
ncbi:MAG: T9SS type A sorting domain-containing protein [Chitinophagales bacterium]|nr:T9SS type A sorting domain-containing protein [Chitinophagales bacterium]